LYPVWDNNAKLIDLCHVWDNHAKLVGLCHLGDNNAKLICLWQFGDNHAKLVTYVTCQGWLSEAGQKGYQFVMIVPTTDARADLMCVLVDVTSFLYSRNINYYPG